MAIEEKFVESDVREALSRVEDPEIGKPITELDMVESIAIDGADVAVGIYLTIAGCPMRDTIEGNVRAVLEELDGVGAVVLDEVHERDLDTDVLFALLADLRQLRPELVLVAMSATVDAAALAARWARGMGEEDPVPVVSTPAVLHPLREEHVPFRGHRLTAEGRVDRTFLDHVAATAASAHAEALAADPSVDALVFLPGVAEVEAWAGEFSQVEALLRPRFGRREPRERAAGYVRSLMAPLERLRR